MATKKLLNQIERAIRDTVQEHLNLEEFIGPPDAADIAHDATLVIDALLKAQSDA